MVLQNMMVIYMVMLTPDGMVAELLCINETNQ
jgi:hypothetical protein